MPTLFVWDFHGVLEKGNENAVLEISNNVLSSTTFKERFTIKDIHKLYGKKWWEYFEFLLPNESHEKHIELQNICFSDQFNDIEIITRHISPSDSAHFVLENIIKSGHSQILISNTSENGLKLFLNATKMKNLFPQGTFAANSHSNSKSSKEEILRKFLIGKNFNKIVIIGDSPGDMKLSSVAGGVRYLYSNREKFRECESDYKITDLREVLKEI